VIVLSSLICLDSLVMPASLPVTTLSPCPRRRVRALMILDLPVLGNPITPTDNVRFRVVERDFKALCKSNESFLEGRLGCEYWGFALE
jgi:hypothetical protein